MVIDREKALEVALDAAFEANDHRELNYSTEALIRASVDALIALLDLAQSDIERHSAQRYANGADATHLLRDDMTRCQRCKRTGVVLRARCSNPHPSLTAIVV